MFISLHFNFWVGLPVSASRLLAAIVVVSCLSCDGPPPKGPPRIVRAKDLANDHLSDRAAAKLAYHNQTLQVSVPGYLVSGSEIHYLVSFDGKPRRPVIVFKFDELPKVPKGTLWIEGHCEGCIDDSEDRGIAGYTFTITVTRCRFVKPPIPAKP